MPKWGGANGVTKSKDPRRGRGSGSGRWQLTLPRGRVRPRRGKGFGELRAAEVATEQAKTEHAALSGDESEEMKTARAKVAAEAKMSRAAGAGSGRRRRFSRRPRRFGGSWTENVPMGSFESGFVVVVLIGLAVVRGCIRSGAW